LRLWVYDATQGWHWDYTIGAAQPSTADAVISDNAGALVPTVAHELGHLLGIVPPYGDYALTSSNGDELMVSNYNGSGTMILHEQVDQVPDHVAN